MDRGKPEPAPSLRICGETGADLDKICMLVQEAFAQAPHRDGTEQDLVRALHGTSGFLPQLSLTARYRGALAGYVLLSPVKVGGDTQLALAPLAVAPRFQGLGIGSALVREGHRTGARLGYGWCLVLGDPAYYGRFGYRPAGEAGILVPEGFPEECFLARALKSPAGPVGGPVRYPAPFGV